MKRQAPNVQITGEDLDTVTPAAVGFRRSPALGELVIDVVLFDDVDDDTFDVETRRRVAVHVDDLLDALVGAGILKRESLDRFELRKWGTVEATPTKKRGRR